MTAVMIAHPLIPYSTTCSRTSPSSMAHFTTGASCLERNIALSLQVLVKRPRQ